MRSGGLTVVWVGTLVSVAFLLASIFFAKFEYISTSLDLLKFAQGLDEDERAAIRAAHPPVDALAEFKAALAEQYAIATDHNRHVNQRRTLFRSIAGFAVLVAILVMIALVPVVVLG